MTAAKIGLSIAEAKKITIDNRAAIEARITLDRHEHTMPGTLDVFIKHAHVHGLHDRELEVFRALVVAAHNLTTSIEKRTGAPYERETIELVQLESALVEATNKARAIFGEP